MAAYRPEHLSLTARDFQRLILDPTKDEKEQEFRRLKRFWQSDKRVFFGVLAGATYSKTFPVKQHHLQLGRDSYHMSFEDVLDKNIKDKYSNSTHSLTNEDTIKLLNYLKDMAPDTFYGLLAAGWHLDWIQAEYRHLSGKVQPMRHEPQTARDSVADTTSSQPLTIPSSINSTSSLDAYTDHPKITTRLRFFFSYFTYRKNNSCQDTLKVLVPEHLNSIMKFEHAVNNLQMTDVAYEELIKIVDIAIRDLTELNSWQGDSAAGITYFTKAKEVIEKSRTEYTRANQHYPRRTSHTSSYGFQHEMHRDGHYHGDQFDTLRLSRAPEFKVPQFQTLASPSIQQTNGQETPLALKVMKQEAKAVRLGKRSEARTFKLFLKTLDGKTITVFLPESAPVADVLLQISRKYKRPICGLKLIAHGTDITQERFLGKDIDHGGFDLQRSSTLHVVVSNTEIISSADEFIKSLPPKKIGTITVRDIQTLEQVLHNLYLQAISPQFTVNQLEFLQTLDYLVTAQSRLSEHTCTEKQNKFIKKYLERLCYCVDIYKLPFIGHQNQVLDQFIDQLKRYESAEHEQFTTQFLLMRLTEAGLRKDETESAKCLLVLLRGLKFNVLSPTELTELAGHPCVSWPIKTQLFPMIRMNAFSSIEPLSVLNVGKAAQTTTLKVDDEFLSLQFFGGSTR